ncbi:Lipase, secreted [Akanthomyces lecanii RCEF 1005]|uniref:Lipase, secreted n=1 Tax=Akanthomyces lecanii RCEF 1005 TaxID=1081108 RepID=A0A162JB24_CORDF|nr:Lipase, secreted [Akanthomyces lecanii RCEF 1005]
MFSLKCSVLVALLHSGISTAAPQAAAFGPVLPTKDSFYHPPAGYEKQPPGAILRNRTVPSALAISGVSAAFQLLYRTTDTFGDASATVTTILIPKNADSTKLLSYQLAEDAANPNCAPSYVMQLFADSGGPFGTIVSNLELNLIRDALKKGWYVSVPDFLGPKSAFLANTMAGHAVLDGIRAAFHADFTKLSKNAQVALWGYSGGSMASEFAAELQATYAPELKIAGAALGGTIPNILSVLNTINKSFFAGLIPSGIVGLANEYPEIAALVAHEIIPSKADIIQKITTQCLGANVLSFMGQDVFSYTKDPNVFNSTLVRNVTDANNPGHITPTMPILIYKGAKDQISPVADTDKLVDKYCGTGGSVEYRRVPDSEHLGLIFKGAPGALNWLSDRLSGVPAKQGCVKSTNA